MCDVITEEVPGLVHEFWNDCLVVCQLRQQFVWNTKAEAGRERQRERERDQAVAEINQNCCCGYIFQLPCWGSVDIYIYIHTHSHIYIYIYI